MWAEIGYFVAGCVVGGFFVHHGIQGAMRRELQKRPWTEEEKRHRAEMMVKAAQLARQEDDPVAKKLSKEMLDQLVAEDAARSQTQAEGGEKIQNDLAEVVGGLLALQVKIAEMCGDTIESKEGGLKQKAIGYIFGGYIFGYAGEALNRKGLRIMDGAVGAPIMLRIFECIWPGKGEEYLEFLASHFHDPKVEEGVMYGSDQFKEFHMQDVAYPVVPCSSRYGIGDRLSRREVRRRIIPWQRRGLSTNFS